MSIKGRVREYKLKRSRNTTFQANEYPGFEKLRLVGIAFEAGAPDQAVSEYARKLADAGKEVRLLGYVPKMRKEIKEPPVFPWFCKNDIKWPGAPGGKEVDAFLGVHFGVYIDLIRKKEHPMDFITARVAADFKIGDAERSKLGYNLMLQMDSHRATEAIFREIDYYLNFINTNKN